MPSGRNCDMRQATSATSAGICPLGEQGGYPGGDELLGRAAQFGAYCGDAPLHLVRRQRPGPPGVRRGQDQRSDNAGMPSVQFEREPGAP